MVMKEMSSSQKGLRKIGTCKAAIVASPTGTTISQTFKDSFNGMVAFGDICIKKK
jgi:hypothetical protein